MSAGDAQLFEDTFTVTEYEQSKYDRVARLTGTSTDNQTELKLDINIELFPCHVGETLQVVLATSLSLDGNRDEDGAGGNAAAEAAKGWRDVRAGVAGAEESTLADMYDYVCHGKIYKFEDGSDGQTMCVPRPILLLLSPRLVFSFAKKVRFADGNHEITVAHTSPSAVF